MSQVIFHYPYNAINLSLKSIYSCWVKTNIYVSYEVKQDWFTSKSAKYNIWPYVGRLYAFIEAVLGIIIWEGFSKHHDSLLTF